MKQGLPGKLHVMAQEDHMELTFHETFLLGKNSSQRRVFGFLILLLPVTLV